MGLSCSPRSALIFYLVILCTTPSFQQGCDGPILNGNTLAKYKASSLSGDNDPSHSPIGYKNHGWCPYILDQDRWIEVDLGSQYVIKRLDIKYHTHFLGLRPVREFVFAWSETGEDGKWNVVQTPFKMKVSSDGLSSYQLRDVPMTSQNVRINVTDPIDKEFCLSLEFYGCSAQCSQTKCPPGYQCTVDEDGKESCDQCFPGLLKKGSDCIARSPCENSSSLCHTNADCVSHIPYEYTCICKKNSMGDGHTCTECGPGYTDNGLGCIDINECETGDNKCHDKEHCINTDGSYTCQCRHGFTRTDKGTGCQDIDECETKDVCPSDKTRCINKEGFFVCECIQKGYVWYGEKCVDINECKANLHQCKNANCVNSDGGYRCRCKEGYRFKKDDVIQRECIDTNECVDEQFQKLCEAMDGSCKNTIGSYKCVCPVGFMMDNELKRCLDRDECKHDKPCSENAFCRNLQGGYRCTCKPGYAGNGRSCMQDLASSQQEQNDRIVTIAGAGGGALLSIIAIIVLAKVCRKKQKTADDEPLIMTAFEPGFEVSYPDEHWQEYHDDDEYDFDMSDDSDDSDLGNVHGEEARFN